jgi:hypothetical protein
VSANPVGEDWRERSFVQRVADERYVVAHLDAVRGAGRLSRGRIGVYGQSVGGADAAEAMFEDRRFDAGVNIDGALLGSVIDHGLDRPFATLLGDFPIELYDGLGSSSPTRAARTRSSASGPPGTRRSPTSSGGPPARREPGRLPARAVDPVDAVDTQRRFLRRFFERYLVV